MRCFSLALVFVLASAGCASAHRPAVTLARDGLAKDVTAVSAAFGPDGRLVAAVTRGGEVAVWDVRSGRLLARRDGVAPVAAERWSLDFAGLIAWSPDGGRVAYPVEAGDGGAAAVWDWRGGTVEVVPLGLSSPPVKLALGPGGRLSAATGGLRYSTGKDKKVVAYDAAEFVALGGGDAFHWRDEARAAWEFALLPDARRLAVRSMFVGRAGWGDYMEASAAGRGLPTKGEALRTLAVIDADTGGPLWSVNGGRDALGLSASADGSVLLVSGGSGGDDADSSAAVEVESGDAAADFAVARGRVLVSNEGTLSIVGVYANSMSPPVFVLTMSRWPTLEVERQRAGGRVRRRSLRTAEAVWPLDISPDGRWMVDVGLCVWKLPTN